MKNAHGMAFALMAMAATACSGGSSAPSPTAANTVTQAASGTNVQAASQSESALAASVSDTTADADADAHARLHEITAFNDSEVRARIRFDDNGTSLHASGVARGMDPSRAYVSLVYFTGSVAKGPQAGQCIPPPGNPLDSAHMLIAYWYPMTGSRVRVLNFTKTGASSYVPLTSIATTSVRWDTTPQVQPVVANPTRLVLQACGKVVPRGDRDD